MHALQKYYCNLYTCTAKYQLFFDKTHFSWSFWPNTGFLYFIPVGCILLTVGIHRWRKFCYNGFSNFLNVQCFMGIPNTTWKSAKCNMHRYTALRTLQYTKNICYFWQNDNTTQNLTTLNEFRRVVVQTQRIFQFESE